MISSGIVNYACSVDDGVGHDGGGYGDRAEKTRRWYVST